jgi:hypothetical protein
VSVDVRIVHPRDFLAATASGEFDLEEGRAALAKIADAPPPGMNILIDARNLKGKGTLPQLFELARELQRLGAYQERKTAILADPAQFEDARFLSMSARGMGVNVYAFSSFEDAFEWLQ